MAKLFCGVVAASLCVCGAEIYFKEEFDDGAKWKNRWVESEWKKEEDKKGKVELKRLENDFVDEERDIGLRTMDDLKFYTFSAEFPTFSNKDKTLVVQYQVTFENDVECGGGYIKLAPKIDSLSDVTSETQYNIMFGPDKCGSTKKTHVIFHHEGKNMDCQKELKTADNDRQTHLYTLILQPNNTFEVRIDGSKVESGTLVDNWPFVPPEKIPDPDDKKPADWDDKKKIPDPEAVKPEDWDDREFLPPSESTATKPDDWDEEEDGEYTPPPEKNSLYKGKWSAPMIDNPNYQGVWKPKLINNPVYDTHKNISELYTYQDFSTLIIDLWQVKGGTHFDNFIITDDPEEALEFADETFKPIVAKHAENEEIRMAKKETETEDNSKDEDDDKDDVRDEL